MKRISNHCLRALYEYEQWMIQMGLTQSWRSHPAQRELEHRQALKITALWRERGRPSGA